MQKGMESTMNVLVLEDNKESRRALGELLHKISEDITVALAATKAEAMELLEKNDGFDLFLLDINLNIRDERNVAGLEFAKEIRERQVYSFTPVVFITSYADFEMTSYREAQCYSYLTKPFSRSEVEKIVRKVMNRQEEKEERYMTVKKDGVNFRIKVNDLVAVQSIVRGVNLFLRKEVMDVKYLTIRQVTEELKDCPEFIQCHRNAIINLNYVENVDFVNRLIQLKGMKEAVEIGVTYKAELKERIG